MRQTALWMATVMLLTGAAATAAEDGFVPLFDGKSLQGWKQVGGKAKYEVQDGVIVGSSVPNTQNSFLCPKKPYGDFVLEFEVKCDPALNSGVQVRSNSLPESDRRPLALCPECMAKVCWAAQADPIERYRKLAAFCREQKLSAEAEFYEKSLRALGVEPATTSRASK